MTAAQPAGAPGGGDAHPTGAPIRIAIVDDSRTMRRILESWLGIEPGFAIVGHCENGRDAVDRIRALRAEIVLLDIEMPEMNGLEALPELVRLVPDLQVIMASQLTTRQAEISLKALAIGAADYVAKPGSVLSQDEFSQFRMDIAAKVRHLGEALRRKRGEPLPAAWKMRTADGCAESPKPRGGPIVLRPPAPGPFRTLAIGSSTGGPKALQHFLERLRRPLPVPVLIAQHMPPTFTPILAEHLGRHLDIPCAEGRDGECPRAGRIYIAPGDRHMVVEAAGEGMVIRITRDPPQNFCRPAVDPLFRSLAAVDGPGTVCVVLTGMGSDGAKGAQAVVEAGGCVLAQDEASSVVWGMPGAAASAGLCCAVDPLPALADRVDAFLKGAAR
ncbi:MAG: chemotaxis response regulator protein-glutamate methylesterase [Alphaproteobacteria bacterium]